MRPISPATGLHRIKHDFQTGVMSGVNGTPSLFINGERYDGPRDVRSLVEALKGKMSKADQAKTLKLLGICQYMSNAKDKAKASFEKALKRDPGLSIGANEVLDESVIP